jgi:hypothetical protein
MLALGAAHAVTSCAQEVTGGGGVGGANTHLQGGKIPGQGQFTSHQDGGAAGLLEVHVHLFLERGKT